MVSVIIPTFNRSPLLKKAIESVLAQTYKDFELIVVDDGSTDDTLGLIKSLGSRIKYLRVDHKGPARARNIGIKNAERPFLAFLDSDDWWNRDKLARQIKFMQEVLSRGGKYFICRSMDDIAYIIKLLAEPIIQASSSARSLSIRPKPFSRQG